MPIRLLVHWKLSWQGLQAVADCLDFNGGTAVFREWPRCREVVRRAGVSLEHRAVKRLIELPVIDRTAFRQDEGLGTAPALPTPELKGADYHG